MRSGSFRLQKISLHDICSQTTQAVRRAAAFLFYSGSTTTKEVCPPAHNCRRHPAERSASIAHQSKLFGANEVDKLGPGHNETPSFTFQEAHACELAELCRDRFPACPNQIG